MSRTEMFSYFFWINLRNKLHVWGDLKFPLRWRFKSRSSGLWPSVVLCYVMLCYVNQRFGGPCCLHLQRSYHFEDGGRMALGTDESASSTLLNLGLPKWMTPLFLNCLNADTEVTVSLSNVRPSYRLCI